MLEVHDLTVRYGAIAALRGVSLTVSEGEIVAIVGPNGAGKSSLLWTLAGDVRAASGTVTLRGTSLLGRKPEEIVRLGLSLVPEDRHVFSSLSVEENLRLGSTVEKDRAAARRGLESVLERFPILGRFRRRPAGQLSGGQQQQLVIARALLARPSLLLLDEPSLGLDPQMTANVFATVRELRDEGTTVVLVEQNAAQSIALADRTYVLRTGRVHASGVREQMLASTDLADAYLGVDR